MKTIKKHISVMLTLSSLIGICPVTASADASADISAVLGEITVSDNVNNDFSLPIAGANGVKLSWESSDRDTILPLGEKAYVLAGIEEKTATLTVTATKDGITDSKDFDIKVEPFVFEGSYIFNDDFESETVDESVWKKDAAFMPDTSDENGSNYMGVATEPDGNSFYKIKRTDNSVDSTKKSYIHWNKDGLPNEARIIYETKILVNQQPKNAAGADIFLNHWWCRDLGNTIGKYSGFAAAYVGGNNGIQIRATLDSAPNSVVVANQLYKWRTLTFDIKSGIGVFDCYLDGKKVATDYKMRAMGAPLKHLAFGFDGNTTGEVWMDDVVVYEYPKGADVLLNGANFGVSDVNAVESDLVLPVVTEGSVEWVSSNPAVIAPNGVVNRAMVEGESEDVRLYAVLNNGGVKTAEEYSFTVIAEEEKEPSELDFLNIDEIIGDQTADSIEKGFELPLLTVSGYAIRWSSSDNNILEVINGNYATIKPSTVERSVMLIASINVDGEEQTRNFVLTVAEGMPMDNEINIEAVTGQNINNIINDFELPSETGNGYAVTWKSDKDDSIFINGSTAYVIRKPDPVPVKLTAIVNNAGVVTELEYELTVAKVDEITNFLINEDFEGIQVGRLPESNAYGQWGTDSTIASNNPNIEIGVKEEDSGNKVMDIFHINPDGNQHSLLHINFNTPKKGSVVLEYKYKYVLTGGQGKDTNANVWVNSSTGYNAAPSGNFVKFPFNDTFMVTQMGANRSHRENYDGGKWHDVKAVLNLDDGIFDMYLDGRKVCENEPKIEGDGAMRMQVGFDRGSAGHCMIDDIKVYIDPVSIVKNYAESIDLGDVTNVVKDIEIPEKTPLGDANIIWVSSNPEVVSVNGIVNNPKEGQDIPVTLWALVESNNNRSVKRFELNVARIKSDTESVELDFENLNFAVHGFCLEDVLRLPTVGAYGSEIKWVSSNPEIISNEGIVSRIPYDNEKITEITLTATISKGDAESKTKSFKVNVPERNYVLDAIVTGTSDRVNKRFEFIKDNDSSTAWAPADNDRQPYLVVELKKTELVNRIVINGTCGDVTVSYKTNNSSTYNRIGKGTDVVFAPKEMKTIKLDFIGDADIQSVGVYYSLKDEDAVRADIEALNFVNLDNVTSNIKIPLNGSVCNSKITAVSSDNRYLSDSGVVTRPTDSDKDIILTLTFTNGSYSESKEFRVHIIKKSSGGGGSGGGGGAGSYSGNVAQGIITAPVKNNNTSGNTVLKEEGLFTDLGSVSWAKKQIEALAKRNMINGIGDGKFEPDRAVSREEFVKLLMNVLDIDVTGTVCSFSDVPDGSWYYEYVAKASELGIINGVGSGKFGTGNPVLRCDMAVMLSRALNIERTYVNDSVFKDENIIPDYAHESVKYMSSIKLMNGFEDGTFRPLEAASRAQAVVVLYNYLQLDK